MKELRDLLYFHQISLLEKQNTATISVICKLGCILVQQIFFIGAKHGHIIECSQLHLFSIHSNSEHTPFADLSGGIAARRKLRQEQREREQLEKERLEKEQREKELAEKAKDERKDIIKRPVPIIREPTPSTSEEQDEKDKQGQRLSSPASRSKVVGMSNGDSSGKFTVLVAFHNIRHSYLHT